MLKQMLSRFVTVVVITVFIVAPNLSTAGDDKAKGLEGSWRVTITEGPGTPLLPNWYQALVTFVPNGGLIATITDSFLQTGHGSWAKKGGRTFAITILLFQFSPAGPFLGTLKARATLEVNDKAGTFDSDDYQFEFFDAEGDPTGFGGVGAAHGIRIKVEPLT